MPVLVTFKSHPYKDVEVIDWQQRLLAANDFYAQPSCDKLQALATEHAITHIVIESGQLPDGCSFLDELYRDLRSAVCSVRGEPEMTGAWYTRVIPGRATSFSASMASCTASLPQVIPGGWRPPGIGG